MIDLTKKKSVCLMAFGKTSETSVGGGSTRRYVGVGTVGVLGVNPSQMELGKMLGRQGDKEPEYVGTCVIDGKDVRWARVDIIVRAEGADNNGIEMTTKLGFFLRKEFRFSRDRQKTQVIDKYGQTAWVTREQLQAHEIPVYSNGMPANLDKDYRPCYIGEEMLTAFIKTYLGIRERRFLEPGGNPDECECRLDSIERYFSGDVTELRDAIAMRPRNKVKVLFGARESADGRIYQDFFDRAFLRPFQTDYSWLGKELKRVMDAGVYPNVVFEACPLKEHVVEATDLSKPAELPFGDPFGEAAKVTNPWDDNAPF